MQVRRSFGHMLHKSWNGLYFELNFIVRIRTAKRDFSSAFFIHLGVSFLWNLSDPYNGFWGGGLDCWFHPPAQRGKEHFRLCVFLGSSELTRNPMSSVCIITSSHSLRPLRFSKTRIVQIFVVFCLKNASIAAIGGPLFAWCGSDLEPEHLVACTVVSSRWKCW